MSKKKIKWKEQLIPAGIIFLAAILRLLFLDWRPPHFDEGIAGWFADQILVKGFYAYDPVNYHGPLHYYLVLLFQFIMGHNIIAVRLPSVLPGILSVWVLTLYKDFLPRRTAWLAALFFAISPAEVFFTRGSILEGEFIFFTLLFFYGFFAARPWVWTLALAGMLVTKETWSIVAIGFVVAFTASGVSKKVKLSLPAGLTGLAIVFLFYSGFLMNFKGVLAFFEAYLPWLRTGMNGSGHEKSITYWFQLFGTYEIIGVAGMVSSLFFLYSKKNPLYSFISIFGVIQFIIYSSIPYKTPWCMVSILWPFLIMAAAGLDQILQTKSKSRVLAMVAVSALSLASLEKSISLSFFKFVDEREPYVYVQTYPDVMNIMSLINEAKIRNPDILKSKLVVIMKSQWPLPWMLADFKPGLYYSKLAGADVAGAGVIFTDISERRQVEAILDRGYYSRVFRLRPAMEQVVVYFSKEMFEDDIKDESEFYEDFEPQS